MSENLHRHALEYHFSSVKNNCLIAYLYHYNSDVLLHFFYVVFEQASRCVLYLGLPNTFGEYDESPEVTASSLKVVPFVFLDVSLFFWTCICCRLGCIATRHGAGFHLSWFSVSQLLLPFLSKETKDSDVERRFKIISTSQKRC